MKWWWTLSIAQIWPVFYGAGSDNCKGLGISSRCSSNGISVFQEQYQSVLEEQAWLVVRHLYLSTETLIYSYLLFWRSRAMADDIWMLNITWLVLESHRNFRKCDYGLRACYCVHDFLLMFVFMELKLRDICLIL